VLFEQMGERHILTNEASWRNPNTGSNGVIRSRPTSIRSSGVAGAGNRHRPGGARVATAPRRHDVLAGTT
jgi:hypothetical protein